MKTLVGFLLVLMVFHVLAERSHGDGAGAGAGAGGGGEIMACARVAGLIGDCFTYLSGIDQKPLSSCCNSLLRFTRAASFLQDKRLACRCFKRAISTFHNIREDALLDLPSQCHVELSILSTDC